MARDYSAEYERRQEAAEARGFDSFYDQRSAVEDVRDRFGDIDDALAVAMFENGFAEGDYDRDSLRDFFDEFIGGDDQDFYDWLEDLYKDT